MKKEKIVSIIILATVVTMLFSFLLSNSSLAIITNSEDKKLNLDVNKTEGEVYAGTEIEVTVDIKGVENFEEGIVAIAGTLEYDKNKWDIIKTNSVAIQANENWDIKENDGTEFKFVADITGKLPIKTSGELFKIKFKAKDTVELGNTEIKIKDFEASGGKGIIFSNDGILTVNITEKKVEPPVESINSSIYNIKDNMISSIKPKTTVAEFKKNVTTESDIVLLDSEGKELTDTDVVKTGTILKVGQTLQYKLSVIGDIDGNGEVNLNDLAKLKLHLIEIKKLESDVELKAADLVEDAKVDINDLARMKLVIIGLRNI